MTKDELSQLSQDIGDVSYYFESKPLTDNIKMLKQDFNIDKIDTPKHYSKIIDDISELLRETRLLFLYSVFKHVCKEENKLYYFDTPFQASMSYTAVIKKDYEYYILDEDGHYRELFTNEAFVRFIDDQYWELFE